MQSRQIYNLSHIFHEWQVQQELWFIFLTDANHEKQMCQVSITYSLGVSLVAGTSEDLGEGSGRGGGNL